MAADQRRFEDDDFKIYERGLVAARGGRGRGQGGPAIAYRGAFRGGRGSGRPTPKPFFAEYSDLTISSEKR